MNFKPIQPGCLAIIKKGEHAGRVVTVIERAQPPSHLMSNGIWTACGPGFWIVEIGFEKEVLFDDGMLRKVSMGSCPEHYLMRIDGGDDEALTTDQEQGVSA